jgi:tellurite resistance protein TehA-like permease
MWQIADIFLFAFFMTLGILRAIVFPAISKNVIEDFSQTSYLGAIVVAWETIVLGVVQFYSGHSSGVYAAEAMFWIAVVGSAFVAFGGIYFMYSRQKAHSLDQVNGVWFLTFIPLIVCSTLGGAVAPHLSYENSISVMVVSFLMWSLGVGMSFMLVPIYIWRLMSTLLPQQAVIINTFVPIGPFGMGAYSTQQLASGLARRLAQRNYTLTNPPRPPADDAYIATIGQAIQWAGIILALFQLAVASFFLVEGILAICRRAPGPFNVGKLNRQYCL